MSVSKLRTLDFHGTFENELGGTPRAKEVAEVLDQMWPEASVGTRGNYVMAPADSERLEKLFTMFGVPMKVAENPVRVVGRAYDVFVLGFASYVDQALRKPDTFDEFAQDWSEDWRAYIKAVAAQDNAEARRLAVKLQPLAPECQYPRGIYLAPLREDQEQGGD